MFEVSLFFNKDHRETSKVDQMSKRLKADKENSRLAHDAAVQQASLKLENIRRNMREVQGDKEVAQATLRNLKVGPRRRKSK